jgi:choline transport protein
MPAETGNMNYVSAVYGVVVFVILVDWFARGRKSFKRDEVSEAKIEDSE